MGGSGWGGSVGVGDTGVGVAVGGTGVGVGLGSTGVGVGGSGVGVSGISHVSVVWHFEHCPRRWPGGRSWLWQALQLVYVL